MSEPMTTTELLYQHARTTVPLVSYVRLGLLTVLPLALTLQGYNAAPSPNDGPFWDLLLSKIKVTDVAALLPTVPRAHCQR